MAEAILLKPFKLLLSAKKFHSRCRLLVLVAKPSKYSDIVEPAI